ncbi:MAG: hypothetical protein MHM6MM_002285 [Cercozoa sp. M6MM]
MHVPTIVPTRSVGDAIVGDFNLRVFLKKALTNLQVDARQQMLEQLQDIIDDVAKDLDLAPGSAIVDVSKTSTSNSVPTLHALSHVCALERLRQLFPKPNS